jgi:hypothetical protein
MVIIKNHTSIAHLKLHELPCPLFQQKINVGETDTGRKYLIVLFPMVKNILSPSGTFQPHCIYFIQAKIGRQEPTLYNQ